MRADWLDQHLILQAVPAPGWRVVVVFNDGDMEADAPVVLRAEEEAFPCFVLVSEDLTGNPGELLERHLEPVLRLDGKFLYTQRQLEEGDWLGWGRVFRLLAPGEPPFDRTDALRIEATANLESAKRTYHNALERDRRRLSAAPSGEAAGT